MLVGEQKLVPEATGNSPDEKMDTESTNGVELCRVSLEPEAKTDNLNLATGTNCGKALRHRGGAALRKQ